MIGFFNGLLGREWALSALILEPRAGRTGEGAPCGYLGLGSLFGLVAHASELAGSSVSLLTSGSAVQVSASQVSAKST
ncbi:MAG: hypothetical protein ACI841_004750 [Planctomycetota bacterium]|jgi:hypothetical protein